MLCRSFLKCFQATPVPTESTGITFAGAARLSLTCPFSQLQTEPVPSQCPANRQVSVGPRRVHRDLGSVSAGRKRSGTGKQLQEEDLQQAERRSGNERKQKAEMLWHGELRDLHRMPSSAAPPSEQAPSPPLSLSQASALRAGAPRREAPPVQAELQQSCGAALQPRAQFPLQSTGLGAAAWHWGALGGGTAGSAGSG